jgi:acyl dehydratase
MEDLVRTTIPLADMIARAGNLVSVSSWVEVTQDMIDRFADVTGDRQFIHVDPARAAAETPFGGTIAHGFLTLSLLSQFAVEAMPTPQGAAMGINYGFDKVRFLAPVRAGSRIRGHFTLAEMRERSPSEWLLRNICSVEIEGSDKPALSAEWLNVVVMKREAEGQ